MQEGEELVCSPKRLLCFCLYIKHWFGAECGNAALCVFRLGRGHGKEKKEFESRESC